ncbi:TPA: hypothetical protein MAN10_001459 [Klebsiella pneumoniae]|nr:hypothetical protein [Klebsiella pneumoniae]
MTDITELAQSLKAAADREMICRDGAETSEIWERTVTPENILALVEALESEKRICATWRKTAEANSEKLEKAQQQTTESENRVRKQNRHICELFDDNTALRQRIAELESRTVKLPPCVDDLHGIGMVMSADAVVEALTSYGIKVEAE